MTTLTLCDLRLCNPARAFILVVFLDRRQEYHDATGLKYTWVRNCPMPSDWTSGEAHVVCLQLPIIQTCVLWWTVSPMFQPISEFCLVRFSACAHHHLLVPCTIHVVWSPPLPHRAVVTHMYFGSILPVFRSHLLSVSDIVPVLHCVIV